VDGAAYLAEGKADIAFNWSGNQVIWWWSSSHSYSSSAAAVVQTPGLADSVLNTAS
jgi:hypothetical protein